jgi:DNA-binding NtrC family response regulator
MTDEELRRLIIGESRAVRELRRLILRFAPLPLPVLIEGPTGVGKELVAEGLHLASGRPGKFVPVNGCALSDGTLESDLFGHRRGAFTGASESRDGFFVEAHRGTIFLDEIDELTLPRQAKLLRVIETRAVRAVGGDGDQSSDFRVVAATNEPLTSVVEEKRFRLDLYHRLCGLVLTVPPLSERRADIPLLAEHFVNDGNRGPGRQLRLTDEAINRLQQQPWPGNVRQLRHLIERAAVLTSGPEVGVGALDEAERLGRGDRPVIASADLQERQTLLDNLERHHWRIEAVAAQLEIALNTVYARIKKYGITIPNRYRRRGNGRNPELGNGVGVAD